MIFRKSKQAVLFGILFFALLACTNSDEFLFNDQESQEIEISAIVTRSFDSEAPKTKADTIQPGDSLIFLTTVSPSKSIRNRQYFWTMDGENFASEYSFQKSINVPGVHKIAFVFVDFFGDTLSDTLTITVATPPIMDTEHFIPATGTQNLTPDSAIHFAWNFNDPDSLWDLSFRFTLQDSDKDTIIDTLLHQAYFKNIKKLSPLQKYTWTVRAYNEFNQKSNETLTASFYTKGSKGKSAVSGTLKTSSSHKEQDFKVILLDSLQAPLDTIPLSGTPNADFNIKPLAKGKYSLAISVDNASDFNADTIRFKLEANQVTQLDTITLADEIPPRIQSLSGNDTLDISDTLRFIVFDHGGPILPAKITISYENKNLSDFTLSKDTLYVPFNQKATAQNWTTKFISVSVTDPSYNSAKHVFYLRPNATPPEVFSE
ncbi:MAG: hypothetical protein IK114_00790 [Fibrobacter sp.]|nr:hypothetical protein [Fibrobacter sp.]